jgi:hypothetical protein
MSRSRNWANMRTRGFRQASQVDQLWKRAWSSGPKRAVGSGGLVS